MSILFIGIPVNTVPSFKQVPGGIKMEEGHPDKDGLLVSFFLSPALPGSSYMSMISDSKVIIHHN
jgi:hypothetical protein